MTVEICNYFGVTCIIKPKVADCSPASIRAVNDFPCNTEDPQERAMPNGRFGVIMCNGVMASLPPACPVWRPPVLQSDVLSLDDSAEPSCTPPKPPLVPPLLDAERETSARADKWTCPYHFYFHLVSWRTALKQYPRYVTLPILQTESELPYIGVLFFYFISC